MKNTKEIKNFYSKVMDCDKNCPFIVKNKKYRPRGFWFNENNKILVVGLNPAEFNKNADEFNLYDNKQGLDLVETHLEYVEKRFTNHKGNYQNYLLKTIKSTTGLSFKEFNITNLVKCSTEKNFTKLPPNIRRELMKNCFERWFKEELETLNPEVIFAYGKEMLHFLHSRVSVKVINLPRIGMNHKVWSKSCLELKESLKQSKILDKIQ